LAFPSFPTLPPREKCTKIKTKYFRNSKKLDPKIEMQNKDNQTVAAYPNLVRTDFEALWKRNKRVTLFLRLMLLSASPAKVKFENDSL